MDASLNLIRIRYLGDVTVPDAALCLEAVKSLLPKMRPEFTILTDLSGLVSMDIGCGIDLAKQMDAAQAHGVGAAVRIIPDTHKDIGFKILAAVHYGPSVRVVTCETIEEADCILRQSE